MTLQDSKYSELGNMSKAEGILRGVVGMAVIEAMLVIPSLSENDAGRTGFDQHLYRH